MTINTRINLDKAFTEIPRNAQRRDLVSREMRVAFGQTGALVQGHMQRAAPTRTGRLRRDIGYRIEKSITPRWVEIGPRVSYAPHLNFGTGIYGPRRTPITPKRAKALRFNVGRRVVFRKSVRGVRPMRFAERSLVSSRRGIPLIWARATERVARGLLR